MRSGRRAKPILLSSTNHHQNTINSRYPKGKPRLLQKRACIIDYVVKPIGPDEVLARIWALLDGFLGYIERGVFAGGCFFATTSIEFKDRPGPVRDRIGEQVAEWRSYIEHAVAQAQELGELDPAVDPGRIAFELNAFVQSAKSQHVFFGDARVFSDARAAVRDRLESLRAQEPLAV